MTAGLTLGAPGVYLTVTPPVPAGVPPVRLDATAFVGLAFRGPAHEPVRVSGWSEFVEVFGGVSDLVQDAALPCPGYLPRAVRAFFDQGGEVAWVCRVVPVAADPAATARLELPGGRALVAADEGRWGTRLEATLSFQTGQPLPVRGRDGDGPDEGSPDEGSPDAGSPDAGSPGGLVVADVPALPAGSVLVAGPGPGRPTGTLHRLTGQAVRPAAGGGRERVLTLDPAPPAAVADVRVVTATLDVLDRDPLHRRADRVTGLGLHPDHPRYPARPLPPDHPAYPGTVLSAEARLVRTADGWDTPLQPADGTLPPLVAGPPTGGADRFGAVGGDAFFDADSPDGDRYDERTDHRGVDRAGRVPELGLLCVPDLGWDRGRFLDPQDPGELAELATRQARLVAVAEFRRRFVALLDAPSRLPVAALARWRAGFDSSYAAAYHPWLRVPGDEPGRPAVPLPPSAVAAGITAARERRLGLARGPANELARTVVTADDLVPDAVHDELHGLHVNVFLAERDGFRLTSARTLSLDPRYRQLSVRRLMTMIVLALERQGRSLVFEPNTDALRATTHHVLTQFLRELFRRGAFSGDSEEESFFVRCDDALNPPESQALGRLVAEIGVALSRPLEYLVVRIDQELDGTGTVTPVVA